MILKVFSLYSLLKTTSGQNVVFMFLKTSNQSLFVLKLYGMSCGDGGIAAFAACKLKILRQPVPPFLWGAVFLEIGKLVKCHANKVEYN